MAFLHIYPSPTEVIQKVWNFTDAKVKLLNKSSPLEVVHRSPGANIAP
jgi:hypothetical protein